MSRGGTRNHAPRATGLLSKRLEWRGVTATIQRLSVVGAEEIDRVWPAMRQPLDAAGGWRWSSVVRRHEDVFVVSVDGSPHAVWSAKHARPRVLGTRSYYRCDLFEVRGDSRRSGWGAAQFVFMCARAVELGATGGVVLMADRRAVHGDLHRDIVRTYAEALHDHPA